jgi:hypothetical protein
MWYRRARRMLGVPVSVVEFATSGISWSAIVGVVLGSSALGAIVGGMITTRMRGRIERDEAWRTRLVDASEGFLLQLDRTTGTIPYGWLIEVESDERPLRSDGKLTTEAKNERSRLMGRGI